MKYEVKQTGKTEYWGFDIEKALKHLNADKYLGEISIKYENKQWSYYPIVLFFSKNPDISKGHKQFPFLFLRDSHAYIGAFDKEQFDKHIRNVEGLKCNKCSDIIYSSYRHDFRQCKCQECFIDGGRDYTRFGGNCRLVNIDLLTGDVT